MTAIDGTSCIPCHLTFTEVRRLVDMLSSVPLPQKVSAQCRKVDAFLTVLGDTIVSKEIENG